MAGVPPKKSMEKVADEKPKNRKTSEAQMKANKKWQAKQSRMGLRMSPELREELEAHAKSRGESLTAFLLRAAKSQIKRDNELKKLDMDAPLSD